MAQRHNTYHLFIDFKAAFDSIARVELYDAMSSFGILAKLISLVRMTMTNVTCKVKVDRKFSGSFAITQGSTPRGRACLFSIQHGAREDHLECADGDFGDHLLQINPDSGIR